MKVLIAEDNSCASLALSLTLKQLGYVVESAANGREAWEIFNRDPVRIIVSDWMMPDMDGLELCMRIRNRAKTQYTYFMLLTAADMTTPNYTLAMNSGVDDFLHKPLDHNLIRTRLRVAERILSFTTEVRQLKELIPICAYCKRVRDDDYWERVESYITQETGSRFSHGICPSCFDEQIKSLDAEYPPAKEIGARVAGCCKGGT